MTTKGEKPESKADAKAPEKKVEKIKATKPDSKSDIIGYDSKEDISEAKTTLEIKAPETKTEKTSDTKTPDTKPEKTSDTKPEKTSDTKPEKTSDTKPEKTSDTKPEKTSDTKPEKTSDTKPEKTSDTKPEKTSESKSDKAIESPESVPGKKTKKESAKKESETVVDNNKKEAVRHTVQQVHEKYGKGSLMLLGSFSAAPVSSISTGCIGLDIALGVRGLPRGRINEIFGPESSGKTTLALQVIANAQKNGGNAAFVDAEHALDAAYCSNLGVDVSNLYISQPDSGEQALEIVEMLVTSNAFDVVVVDSVAALVPRAELAGEMGDSHIGLQARLMSQALRKLAGVISKTNTCVIFINQLREKIGVYFGNPETTPGGRALKFYTSVRIEIRKIESIKRGEAMVGSRVRAKVVKNKVAPPFRESEFEIEFGRGVISHRNLGEEAVAYDLVQRGGSSYRYKEQLLADSKERFFDYIESHPELQQELTEILLRDVPIGKLTRKKKEGKKGLKDTPALTETDPTPEAEKDALPE